MALLYRRRNNGKEMQGNALTSKSSYLYISGLVLLKLKIELQTVTDDYGDLAQ